MSAFLSFASAPAPLLPLLPPPPPLMTGLHGVVGGQRARGKVRQVIKAVWGNTKAVQVAGNKKVRNKGTVTGKVQKVIRQVRSGKGRGWG